MPENPHTGLAGERLRLGVVAAGRVQAQAERLARRPGVQRRLREAGEPDLVGEAEGPARPAPRQADQPVAPTFFCAQAGSGLVSQRLARFQPTPRRESACRIVSPESTVGLSPCPCASRARRSRVQVLLAWPKARGGWCRIARSRSRSASPGTGAALLGRDEPAVRAARPPASKARMPLRTVCVAQRRSRAIARGRRPSALASTIWARRTVKALGARRPASSRARSAALGSRTKMGGCIPARCDLGRLAQGLAWVCTRPRVAPRPSLSGKERAAPWPRCHTAAESGRQPRRRWLRQGGRGWRRRSKG